MHFEPTLRGGCGRAWNARLEYRPYRESAEARTGRVTDDTHLTLRIGHSAEAAGLHRNLTLSSDRLSAAMQRLSSGLRINSDADDASGLSLDEKMRGQIRGRQAANHDVQYGISMLNTMAAALQTDHSILQRARELAVRDKN